MNTGSLQFFKVVCQDVAKASLGYGQELIKYVWDAPDQGRMLQRATALAESANSNPSCSTLSPGQQIVLKQLTDLTCSYRSAGVLCSKTAAGWPMGLKQRLYDGLSGQEAEPATHRA